MVDHVLGCSWLGLYDQKLVFDVFFCLGMLRVVYIYVLGLKMTSFGWARRCSAVEEKSCRCRDVSGHLLGLPRGPSCRKGKEYRGRDSVNCKNRVFGRKEPSAARDFAFTAGIPYFDLFGFLSMLMCLITLGMSGAEYRLMYDDLKGHFMV